MHNMPLPVTKSIIQARENELTGGDIVNTSHDQEKTNDKSKKVKFSQKIDDDHEGDWRDQQIKKLEERYAESLLENAKLK